jgi:hypothetical protein
MGITIALSQGNVAADEAGQQEEHVGDEGEANQKKRYVSERAIAGSQGDSIIHVFAVLLMAGNEWRRLADYIDSDWAGNLKLFVALWTNYEMTGRL